MKSVGSASRLENSSPEARNWYSQLAGSEKRLVGVIPRSNFPQEKYIFSFADGIFRIA